jgi:hypothetical protein
MLSLGRSLRKERKMLSHRRLGCLNLARQRTLRCIKNSSRLRRNNLAIFELSRQEGIAVNIVDDRTIDTLKVMEVGV